MLVDELQVATGAQVFAKAISARSQACMHSATYWMQISPRMAHRIAAARNDDKFGHGFVSRR